MALTGVLRAEFELLVADVPAKIGLHYRRVSGGPAAFPGSDLAAILFTTVWVRLKAILATNTLLMRIIVRPLDGASGPPYEANYDETVKGTAATAEPLPPSLALLLKLTCSSTNSKNNGHVYIPGIPEAAWLAGVWEAVTFVPLVNLLETEMQSDLTGASGALYRPCVVSRFDSGVELLPPDTYDVLAVDYRPRISQQRRRQSGKQNIKT